MNTLQEVAQFLRASSPISLRALGQPSFNSNQPISMRQLIHRLETLPDISLQATVSPLDAQVPFTVTLWHTAQGYLSNQKWQVFQGGSVLIAELPNDQPYKIETPLFYTFKIIQTGFDSTGYREVSKSFTVSAREKSPTPTPSPSPNPGGNSGGTSPLPSATYTFCVTAPGSGAQQQELTIIASSFSEARAKLIKEHLPNGDSAGWSILSGSCI